VYPDDDDEGLFGTGIPRGATGLGPVLGGSNTDTSTTVPSESTSSGSPAAAASQQGLPLAAAASQSQSNLVQNSDFPRMVRIVIFSPRRKDEVRRFQKMTKIESQDRV